MATMVKEKRREKKKAKEKHSSRNSNVTELSEQPPIVEEVQFTEEKAIPCEGNKMVPESHTIGVSESITAPKVPENSASYITEQKASNFSINLVDNSVSAVTMHAYQEIVTTEVNKDISDTNKIEVYKELSRTLDRMTISSQSIPLTVECEVKLENPVEVDLVSNVECQDILESALPSAPLFELEIPQFIPQKEAVVSEIRPKIQCMSLEEAINWFGGVEMAEVRAMSEREEALVEAGPVCGPEHPLVDLLSTFRYSIIAIDRERSKLAHGYSEEEKSRSTLWKIEKRNINIVDPCACGANVSFKGTYEHATLLKERLPVARLRLESLLRDVQESYCHYQYAALLAHCQIEELISETIQSSKPAIREALSLILQALRVSDNAPPALASALQRWAEVLASALVDMRDLRNLLFLIHHLFRQTRSVQWAARTIRLQVVDRVSAAQAIAVLDLLLARPKPRLDSALECTEETDEAWEEVDRRGEGSAVSEGSLRERDLLAILAAMPLRSLVATLVQFTHSDIRQAREWSWGGGGGGEVVRACCGVRALVATCARAVYVHAQYARLNRTLRALVAPALHALAALHMHSRDKGSYTKEMETKIAAELQACFTAGFTLFGTEDLHKLPATLLSDDMSKEYCMAFIMALHDSSERKVNALSIVLPVPLLCGQRVKVVTHAAIDRLGDHELATMVLHFLLQTGIKRKLVQCKGSCDEIARQWECLPRLIHAHPYLHTIALHALPDLNIVEPLDPSSIKVLNVKEWRPMSGEIIAVLDDWAQRCPQLLQHLLLELDYTPYVGLSLDTQLAVGRWVCRHVKSTLPPEWAWSVLRRLRVHATCWHVHAHARASAHAYADAPPDEEPADVFSMAYALLSTAWGHSIPLICSSGVSALCTLAATRPRDAVHCLAPIMLVMAHSPESVSLTPKFTELFTILLSSGPTLVQRALGRGGACGADLLLRLLLYQLRDTQCGSVLRSSVLSCWLHALWHASLPAACALLEAAAIATREWPLLDSHAMHLLASANSSEYISSSVRSASQAPLLCECTLRARHALEVRTQLFPRLLHALRAQRLNGHRIHVDNALQQLGTSTRSEELVIYRVCSGALTAPTSHPSHVALWRLLLHLYLQRAPDNMQESEPPVGPLFFSGLIKSRTLNQIKKRLQETIAYHKSEAETYKKQLNSLNKIVKPSTSNITKSSSNVIDDNLLPALSIIDLTGESSDSSDSESLSEEEEKVDGEIVDDRTEETQNLFNLLLYHNSAEKLFCEYSRWLDEGDKTRAAPHHADIGRFIPEHALEAAWRHTLSRLRPPPSPELDDFPLPAARTPPVEVPQHTPFNIAVDTILKIRDRSGVRSRRTMIQSPVDDVDFKDSRTLLTLVDKHLKDIERLAQEWNAEVYRVSALDNSLWDMVVSLRVRRPVPDVKKQCPNKCKSITLRIPAEEWCISTGAESGIKENRSSARAGIRRLARPRPHVARTATALSTIARRVRNVEGARRVLERAWCAAAACGHCAHAHHTVTTLVADLADRWVCSDGRTCAELLSRWCGRGVSGGPLGALEAALCGALVAPRRLPPADLPLVYCALLATQLRLPSHSLFSYLSRFEMARYSEIASAPDRRNMLEALTTAAQRWGPAPEPQHVALVELLGVHSHALVDASELCAHVVRSAHATRAVRVPPAYWDHVVRAVVDRGGEVPFDQLGNLLRELGAMWWEVRTSIKNSSVSYVQYGGAIARLFHALLRAFVRAALALSYTPERVAWYAYHALQESWSPWVSPHHSPPLLPSTADDEVYTTMLRSFVDTVQQIISDCPGTEVYLLQQIFEWTVQTHATAQNAGTQETHVQMSALLAGLERLPWTMHQWFYGKTLNVALQVCSSCDKEVTSWCCRVIGGSDAHTLVRDDTDTQEQVAPRLAALLYLFTAPNMNHTQALLEEATRLPWWRLPELALDEAMERFFVQHHNPVVPYHDLPQFRVILYAAELMVSSPGPSWGPEAAVARSASREKRARGVSQCVRALSAHTLAAHQAHATLHLLNTITLLESYLNSSGDEIEELLSRAVVILCMEPAAAAALPVWIKWVRSTSPRMIRACISAAGVLTAFEYFATLADEAARAHLTAKESTGWVEVIARWSGCPWREAHALCARTRLHAAYALARTHAHTHTHTCTPALKAILTCDNDFVENETIIAVWICFACRISLECGTSSEDMECKDAAWKLLARWADQPRRSLLRVVTLHADTDRPTARHRLLCRFAQCVLSPSENATRAYEAACSTVFGSTPGDVITWARSPHHKRLPRLAIRLYPNYEVYFKDELDLAPDDS